MGISTATTHNSPRFSSEAESAMPDFLTRKERSALMSRIRSKDTSPERTIRSMLHVAGYRFRKHLRHLPGTPDIVFTSLKVAVFVDGDFWHGYRFPKWKHKLSEYWALKIETNRRRDKRVFARLRRNGWRVLRLWEHELKKKPKLAFEKIIVCLTTADRVLLPRTRSRNSA